MKYTLHENLDNYNGIISNLNGFLNRHLDTGFKSKWSGFWAPPYKYLDYYGIKINGLWLSPETLEATEYGEKLIFHHETDSLEITEKVLTPDELSGFKLVIELKNNTHEKKAVHTALETGIDIRKVDQDLGPAEYDIEREKNTLKISNKNGELDITAEEFEVKKEPYIKEHYPGEKQRCLVPGNILFRKEVDSGEKEVIEVEFKTSDKKSEPITTVEQDFKHPLGRTFNSSIDSMKNLVYDQNGVGIIAGHPWFQSYWARDTFWTLLGLIDAGYFELSHQILENFAEKQVPGKINLDGEDELLGRSDTKPLFILTADKLKRHYKISEEIEKAMENSMETLEIDKNNIVKHSEDGTWMDTITREKAVDIQSLWLEAAKIMDDKRSKNLQKGLEKFKQKNQISDELEQRFSTINPTIPLMLDQFDNEITRKQLEKVNGEFTSQYGARTRSAVEIGYESSGYHTGSTWGLTTCWAAAANLKHGNLRQGENLLQKMESLLDRNQPGALPEVVDSESGELLGCPEQAWSAGLIVHAIDTYLLGIKVKEEYVEINPCEGVNAERTGKRIRDEKIDLKIKDGKVKLLNDPDLEIRIKD